MKVIETVAAMKAERSRLSGTVGFVPTMGYLHEGHMTLVRQARAENLSVIVSIFINPTQFGPGEDFEAYPRDTQRDLAMLEKEGVNIVFMPAAADMYPPDYGTWIDIEKITDGLEGDSRPGHFRGVATVVCKLFNIVSPHHAYFGQKDYQQLAVIRKIVADLNMDIEIVSVPTVRESDGLAMSSRNIYLTKEERQASLILWKALCLVRGRWESGERDCAHLRRDIIALIEKEPFAKIDYVSVADAETLEELDTIDKSAVVSLAVKFGKTRLIDNTILGSRDED